MPRLIVALGGNLGEVAATFMCALQWMPRYGLNLVAVSQLYETAPWPAALAQQPPYTNAACLLCTSLGPWAVLRRLKKIERRLGRRRNKAAWQARVVDLDLIAYEGVTIQSRQLILPHPRAHLRRFVMGPVADVAPDWPIGTTRHKNARSLWLAMNSENGEIYCTKAWRVFA